MHVLVRVGRVDIGSVQRLDCVNESPRSGTIGAELEGLGYEVESALLELGKPLAAFASPHISLADVLQLELLRPALARQRYSSQPLSDAQG